MDKDILNELYFISELLERWAGFIQQMHDVCYRILYVCFGILFVMVILTVLAFISLIPFGV